jgi:hypothetical protein
MLGWGPKIPSKSIWKIILLRKVYTQDIKPIKNSTSLDSFYPDNKRKSPNHL